MYYYSLQHLSTLPSRGVLRVHLCLPCFLRSDEVEVTKLMKFLVRGVGSKR
ncbi:hypothetical protein GYH30_049401 [Glycine max]|uniref:Uncharacterized protein n=2 Tax=Glycine subgen. Soja TaxID=1462606 RepID=A0A0R0EXT5_SOYBN|nr:hypothetical protein GYH30_049401 [Glycine max]RZB51191.1 hypothetical protein D0Y65_047844 [Glycine soja]